MALPGVLFDEATGTGRIDHSVFPKDRYVAIAEQLHAYTAANLTTAAMALL